MKLRPGDLVGFRRADHKDMLHPDVGLVIGAAAGDYVHALFVNAPPECDTFYCIRSSRLCLLEPASAYRQTDNIRAQKGHRKRAY